MISFSRRRKNPITSNTIIVTDPGVAIIIQNKTGTRSLNNKKRRMIKTSRIKKGLMMKRIRAMMIISTMAMSLITHGIRMMK